MMKQATTAQEVLDRYAELEQVEPAWERTTHFSWQDMILLKEAIEDKNETIVMLQRYISEKLGKQALLECFMKLK